MAIIRFNPFFQSSLLRSLWNDEEEWPEMTMTDGLDVFEEEGKVIVKASVPGIPEDRLTITYEDGVLRIEGKYEEKEEEKKKNRVVHKMQRVSSFNYTTYLPRPIDDKKLEAVINNGVVTITAPIAEAAKPKRIPVKLHSK